MHDSGGVPFVSTNVSELCDYPYTKSSNKMKFFKLFQKLNYEAPISLSVRAKFPPNELLLRRQQKARQALGGQEVKSIRIRKHITEGDGSTRARSTVARDTAPSPGRSLAALCRSNALSNLPIG